MNIHRMSQNEQVNINILSLSKDEGNECAPINNNNHPKGFQNIYFFQSQKSKKSEITPGAI